MTRKKLDPYAELGVDRDATTDEIKKAYRDRARQTHPDRPGGSEAAFVRTSVALAILGNAKARRQFDETGEAEAPPPDNEYATALEFISKFAIDIMNEYIKGGMQPHTDPRRQNFVALVRERCERQLEEAKANADVGVKAIEFQKDLLKRLKKTDDQIDVISRATDPFIRQNEEKIKAVRNSIAALERALEILKTYKFDRLKDSNMAIPILGGFANNTGTLW